MDQWFPKKGFGIDSNTTDRLRSSTSDVCYHCWQDVPRATHRDRRKRGHLRILEFEDGWLQPVMGLMCVKQIHKDGKIQDRVKKFEDVLKHHNDSDIFCSRDNQTFLYTAMFFFLSCSSLTILSPRSLEDSFYSIYWKRNHTSPRDVMETFRRTTTHCASTAEGALEHSGTSRTLLTMESQDSSTTNPLWI